MPHLILEYSANLEDRLDIDELVNDLHVKAMTIDGLPVGGLRTRAAKREHYQVADRDPLNAFLHVILKLGHGRPEEKRKEFGQVLFEELCNLLEPVQSRSPLAISFEIQEVHPKLTWKKNNLREYMAQRGQDN